MKCAVARSSDLSEAYLDMVVIGSSGCEQTAKSEKAEEKKS
jgi:RNA polymerase subunit RPABC4/transcription elongation factor Spt4